jgi:hypothetical protein
MHATSAGTFEFAGLAPGEYYIVAVGARHVFDWQDAAFLESLIPAATEFTLEASRESSFTLKTIASRGR